MFLIRSYSGALFAALTLSMTAITFVSCDKNDEEIKTNKREVTITIAPPKIDGFTKVAMTDVYDESNHGWYDEDELPLPLMTTIDGWEEGDKVLMVAVEGEDPFYSLKGSAEFTCVDAAKGTFTGVLPVGINSKDEFKFAVVNAKDVIADEFTVGVSIKNRVSTNIKDVVTLYAERDEKGCYEMKIWGSILKVTNNTGAPIETAMKRWQSNSFAYLPCNYIFSDGILDICFDATTFDNCKFTIPEGVSYVYVPNVPNDGRAYYGFDSATQGLTTRGSRVVPVKHLKDNAKIYTYQIDYVIS